MYNGNFKISESFSLKTSAHVRFFKLVQFYQQEIYRAGLTYSINKNFNITAGMVYSIKEDNFKSESEKTYEYRFYEDFNWIIKHNNFLIRPRIRIEHSTNNNTNFNVFHHRIRFGTSLQYPILKKTVAYVFDEIFLNANKEVFGENRVGAGFIYTISKPIRFQLGYMHINFGDTHLNRLQIGILINADLHKKIT